MSYRCINHPDTAAALLITNLETGDSVELCGPCVHPWASAIAAATDPDGVPAEHDTDTDDDQADDLPAAEPAEPAEPAGPAEAEPGEGDEVEPDAHGDVGDWAPAAGLIEAVTQAEIGLAPETAASTA